MSVTRIYYMHTWTCRRITKNIIKNSKAHNCLIKPAVSFLGICTREMKNYVHIKMCTQVFQSALFVITKLPQMEITYVSLVGQMLKQTRIHASHELPHRCRKKWSIDVCNSLKGLQINHAEWNQKLFKRGYILWFIHMMSHTRCDSIHVSFLKWYIHRDGKEVAGCQKQSRWGRNLKCWWRHCVSWMCNGNSCINLHAW